MGPGSPGVARDGIANTETLIFSGGSGGVERGRRAGGLGVWRRRRTVLSCRANTIGRESEIYFS